MPDPAEAFAEPLLSASPTTRNCKVGVIWIDWYAYHLARFRGLESAPALAGGVAGIELVGGIGVHAGLKFREELPRSPAIETLMPESSWQNAGQLRLARMVWRSLSKLQPGVVLVPGYYTLPALAAALWAKLHHTTSVLMTESTLDDHGRVWWKEAAKSLLIRALFDWAVSGGKAHVRYLEKLHFPADRVARFYDVVENQFFHQATLALRQDSSTSFGLPSSYFLYIGRLAPEKNVEGLIESWIAYRERGGTWPLVLVGAGPSADGLRARAEACRFLADIYFAGHQGSARLPIYYAFAGCFVLPSTREPWGLVVNEAMASSLPVLVSDRCGCAEDLVLSGVNGFVFDPSQTGDLERCMTHMERLSSRDREAMGTHSFEHIAEYSPENFGRQIAAIWSERDN